jgi:hypothetical protein
VLRGADGLVLVDGGRAIPDARSLFERVIHVDDRPAGAPRMVGVS